ncbi:MAG: 5'-3' exonuclease, partial [Verrucomicrobia bacterium]|nr:5'-3' exonuclease [Verrucomicrobiota bacterium]
MLPALKPQLSLRAPWASTAGWPRLSIHFRRLMKLLLVDGYYYAYRSFHALIGLKNSRGEPNGAIYGFLKALRRMQRDLRPDRAAVVWDCGIPERRSSLQPGYKAQRAEMPEALEKQLPALRELVQLLGFHSVSLPDTEADDLMASYALSAHKMGWESVLATADKDLFQILCPSIRIYTTQKTELATAKDTYALLDAETVQRKWGVAPGQLGDWLSIVGDAADNIPGVPGVGPKGATALLSAHGSLNALMADLERVDSPKLREKLAAAHGQLEQNREMVRLDLDLPLPVAVSDLRIVP